MKTKLTTSLFILLNAALLPAADWPQWRGPTRDGQFTGAAWPQNLDTNHLQQVWRAELGPSYSGPIVSGDRVFTTETKDKTSEVVTAFDRKTGKVLWTQPVEAFRGMNILTPLASHDTLFTSTYGGKTIGFKVAEAGGQFTVTEAWTHKAQGYMSTPVVIDGVAYNHLKSQRVMAIDVEPGRELWTSDKSFDKYWSLIARVDRILALNQRGVLFLLRENKKKFDLLDQRKLTDAETWAHLALAGDEVFVRELKALVAYHWVGETGSF